MNPITRLLKSHRSIRKFTEEKISREILIDIIEAGQCASSSNHVQAYSIIRISDEEKREKIASLAGGQDYVNNCAEFLVFCADIRRSIKAAETLGRNVVNGMTEQLIVATVDASIMAQNVTVAAESHGLGVCYIGGVRNNPKDISMLLSLPLNVFPVFGMCIGYPGQSPDIKPRLPTAAILKEEGYFDDGEEVRSFNKIMYEYYKERNSSVKESDWAEQISPIFTEKLRPHMREFLLSKGFGSS